MLSSAEAAVKFRQRIVRDYFVRFHMGLILSATTAAGLISSKLLLMAGLTSIPIRYPLATVLSYLIFLGMMRLWVAYVLNDVRVSPDGVELDGDSFPIDGQHFGGGGTSGGGGASDAWDDPYRNAESTTNFASAKGGGSSSSSLDLGVDLEDGIWILVALAVVVLVICGAGGYLIWVAPEILPEIAFNALLAGCLSGSVKRAEAKGWVRSVVWSTWIPFLLVLLTTVGLAVVVHRHCPDAAKMTEALQCRT